MIEENLEIKEAPSTSTVSTRHATQAIRNIELVGDVSHQIIGAKLPSQRQVLEVMFFNMRFVYLKARESARLTINAAQVFWLQARIPCQSDFRCVDKLIKLYEKWKKIQKTAPNKRSQGQKETVNAFVESLDDLFDIAAEDALETIRIEEDKEFLTMQREKGRPGSMIGVDMTLHGREKRSQTRREKEKERKRKYDAMSQQAGNFVITLFLNRSIIPLI